MQTRRTDLAIELSEGMAQTNQGMQCLTQQLEDGIEYTQISIHTPEAAKRLHRPQGRYFSLQWTGMEDKSKEQLHGFARCGAKMLCEIMDWEGVGCVLAVGLGNRSITPDAYGPHVCDTLFVTRHLQQELPGILGEGYRQLCAIVPGVMGMTGIQTAETVRGVCRQLKPDLVVAIDALASEQTERIGAVLQVSDVGITPGSGFGNAPCAIDRAYLEVPVLALGVPTVTYASVIARGLFDRTLGKYAGTLDKLLARTPGSEMIVTPKHIDVLVKKAALATAMAVNMAVHPGFDAEMAALLSD